VRQPVPGQSRPARGGTGPQELRAESDVSWLWNLPVSYDTSEPVRRHPARPAESLEGGLQ